jgi:4-amino-4-deoxy-L-arabinose transferase-like glycosyltransferase
MSLTNLIDPPRSLLPFKFSVPRPTADATKKILPILATVVAFLWCVALFFFGITRGELVRNETLRAILAAEMLHSGDYVVPRLYGEPLLTKPPLHYWLIALASSPVGKVTEGTARVPAAVAATLVVLLVFHHLSRLGGLRRGFVTALLLPCSFMWLEKATSAEIDMVLVAWVTAAMLMLDRAVEAEESGASHFSVWGWWLAALLCVAGGVMTKWLAWLFFYLAAVPFLFWRGRLSSIFRGPHLVAASLATGLCLWWFVLLVERVGWAPFWEQFHAEAAPRLLHTANRSDRIFVETLYHPLLVWCVGLPTTLLLPIYLVRRWRGVLEIDGRTRRFEQLLHCWLWPNLALLTLLPDHSLRNSFPILPAMAMLGSLAMALHRRRTLYLLGICVFAWLGVKLVYVDVVQPRRYESRQAVAKAAELRRHVPMDATLYLCGVKDEGLMFYFNGPVRRWSGECTDPRGQYVLYSQPAWYREVGSSCHRSVLAHLRDAQGDPLILALTSR